MAPPRNQLERPQPNHPGTNPPGTPPPRRLHGCIRPEELSNMSIWPPIPLAQICDPPSDAEFPPKIYRPGFDPTLNVYDRMDAADKIGAALLRAKERFGGDLTAEMEDFFSAEGMLLTAGILGVWGGSHYFGVGFLADLGLAIWFGQSFLRLLYDFTSTAIFARNDEDIDRAAQYLNKLIVMVGIAVLTAAIFRLGRKLGIKLPKRNPSKKLPAPVAKLAEVSAWLENLGISRKPEFVRNNLMIALEFLKSKCGYGRPEKMADLRSMLRGIDLSKPVTVETIPAGKEVIMYGHSRYVGNFMTNPGTPTEALGIAQGERVFNRFRVKKPFEVLRSSAADIVDTWTRGRTEDTISIMRNNDGSFNVTKARGEMARGGGTQYTIPDDVKNAFNNPDAPLNEYLERIVPPAMDSFTPKGTGQ